MKILIADKDPVSQRKLKDALEGWGFQVLAETDGQRVHELLLGTDPPTLAVLDWTLPELRGAELCRKLSARGSQGHTYVIMLTENDEPALVAAVMKAGADDFLCKPVRIDELELRGRAGKRICELEQRLRLRATHDALTGIYNRGAIIEILQITVSRHKRDHAGVAIIFADLDHFSRINEEHGQLAGDAVLREVSQRIGYVLREYDSVGRYGGEELLVVLPTCDARNALEVAERIRLSVCAQPILTPAGPVSASVSLGVSVLFDETVLRYSELIQLADQALHEAKNSGRNQVVLARSAHASARA
ncbi:GGDEF domain-containing protein [Massilia glaciei]|uniref:diguanylate cyclase n=1 Tax=Massilia glaciei TaxID=1524097 RepID=A0A2U2I7K6_9BURK|nr:diguanylate cyclase [Massilia glaciei]PWF55743.1 GGDEF domain-containing protein [Massilia glaciei]